MSWFQTSANEIRCEDEFVCSEARLSHSIVFKYGTSAYVIVIAVGPDEQQVALQKLKACEFVVGHRYEFKIAQVKLLSYNVRNTQCGFSLTFRAVRRAIAEFTNQRGEGNGVVVAVRTAEHFLE